MIEHYKVPTFALERWLGWTIDLRSGAVEAPERGEVRTFPVRLVDGEVFIAIAASGPCDQS